MSIYLVNDAPMEESMIEVCNGQTMSKEEVLNPKFPVLPPIFEQLYQIAPAYLKEQAVLCALAPLGTLASKLRAVYRNGEIHSPSFLICLDGEQASGKDFIPRMAKKLLAPIMQRDEVLRRIEKENNIMSGKRKQEGKSRIQTVRGIRYIAGVVSQSMLAERMDKADGLHIITVSEELDTVAGAFKKGFSDYSVLLRVAFNNDIYGQDYLSKETFCGYVKVFYNTLYSGTPDVVKAFYNNIENGMVSRVLFVRIPDQFGKKNEEWQDLCKEDQEYVKKQLAKLDAVSIVDNVIQPEHYLKIDFLKDAMMAWVEAQMDEAVETDDRTRYIFCKRSAVIGFRAGMLAWYLYGEEDNSRNRRNTIEFAYWVASKALEEHLLRFDIGKTAANTVRWQKVYDLLDDEFTRDELTAAIKKAGTSTDTKKVVSLWSKAKCIEVLEISKASSGNNQAYRFKKTG